MRLFFGRLAREWSRRAEFGRSLKREQERVQVLRAQASAVIPFAGLLILIPTWGDAYGTVMLCTTLPKICCQGDNVASGEGTDHFIGPGISRTPHNFLGYNLSRNPINPLSSRQRFFGFFSLISQLARALAFISMSTSA